MNEIWVPEGQRGRRRVPLVVGRQLSGLPFAGLDLRNHLHPGAVGGRVDDVGVEVAGRVDVSQQEREGFLRAQHFGPDVGGAYEKKLLR